MLELIIHLLFVQPSGETYTQQEQEETVQAIERASAFWNVPVRIVSTQVITTNVNVYSETIDKWASLKVVSPQTVYLYVIDNSEHHNVLFTGYGGYAQNYFRLIVILNDADQDAYLAHELGHILYNLPDWYLIPGKCNSPDIMCGSVDAFRKNIKGCNTLEFLGTPCYKVYIPLIQVQYPGIANSGKIS